MEYRIKRISTAGIAEAIPKAELYRSLSEPEEAESICRDILTIEPRHQLALRLLGLSMGPIVTGKPKKSSGSSRIRTSGSTTLGFCTSDAQRRSSTPGNLPIPFWRFLTTHYTLSQKLRRSVRQKTMMNGESWNRNWSPSRARTPRRNSKSPRFGKK